MKHPASAVAEAFGCISRGVGVCVDVAALGALSQQCVCSIKNAELGLLFCIAVLVIMPPQWKMTDGRWNYQQLQTALPPASGKAIDRDPRLSQSAQRCGDLYAIHQDFIKKRLRIEFKKKKNMSAPSDQSLLDSGT